MSVEDPESMQAAFLMYNEAKEAVDIPVIFRGNVPLNYVKDYDSNDRAKREQKQIAAQMIQRNYRKHLKDKRFIENRMPVDPELLKWAREYKREIAKRRAEKQKSLKVKERE